MDLVAKAAGGWEHRVMVSRDGRVRFGVLGPLEISIDGRSVAVGSAQVRQLLAALLVEANVVISADRLVEVLWGDEPPARASSSVQKLVYRLRSLLGPGADELVVTRAPGYVVRIDPEILDAARFEALVSDARDAIRAGDAVGALELLDTALGLWRGPAFGSSRSRSSRVLRRLGSRSCGG